MDLGTGRVSDRPDGMLTEPAIFAPVAATGPDPIAARPAGSEKGGRMQAVKELSIPPLFDLFMGSAFCCFSFAP